MRLTSMWSGCESFNWLKICGKYVSSHGKKEKFESNLWVWVDSTAQVDSINTGNFTIIAVKIKTQLTLRKTLNMKTGAGLGQKKFLNTQEAKILNEHNKTYGTIEESQISKYQTPIFKLFTKAPSNIFRKWV